MFEGVHLNNVLLSKNAWQLLSIYRLGVFIKLFCKGLL